LVNGRPVNSTYFLQNGDEIQLSVGGPRMGFIIPQGKQAMTSSIRLTERMNLFRQQALRPYRRAVWALGILLLLAIIGFGAWNYSLGLKNEALQKDNEIAQAKIAETQNKVDSLTNVTADLKEKEREIRDELAKNPDSTELQQELASYQRQLASVQGQLSSYRDENQRLRESFADNNHIGNTATSATKSLDDINGYDDDQEELAVAKPAKDSSSSDNIIDYYNDIYTLKVRRISLEYAGKSYDPGIATSNIVVGTGFVVDGKFITARSNIHPWIYREVYRDAWREELAIWVAAGFKVIIDYEAYSTRGSGYPLRFSSNQFDEASLSANDQLVPVEITRDYRNRMRVWGIDFDYSRKVRETYMVPLLTPKSFNAATLMLGAPGGLPVDNATSQALRGGEEVVVAGFSDRTDIQRLSDYFKYFTNRTSRVSGNIITLQSADSNWGFTGAPAFYKENDGTYRVIGVNVGVFNGEERIVPIHFVR
jgi:cell division protein FtsB